MFTGLIEGRGIVRSIGPEGPAVLLVLEAPAAMAGGCSIGESVAINGCCLTAVDVAERRWSFQAGVETLARTNLASLEPGDAVNLERALPAGGRIGGHFVQGHIDGTGSIEEIEQDEEWARMWFRIPEPIAAQLVPKGSVCVDGVSLTVVDAEAERFSVALIPHTLEMTTLGLRRPGERVNIETDILGKYVQKFVGNKEAGGELAGGQARIPRRGTVGEPHAPP